MRLIVDSLIAMMLICILGAVVVHYQQEQRRLHDVRFVHRSLARLHEQATFRSALRDAADGEEEVRFPARVAPQWFERDLPLNVLVPLHQPWIDVAPEGDMAEHPPDPVLQNSSQAGFWYNPNRGIFRARVEPQLSEKRTLEMYNRVNGTALLSLPRDDTAARAPTPNPVAPEPGLRHAAREAASTPLDRTVQQLRRTADTLFAAGPAVAHAAQRKHAESQASAAADENENENAAEEAETAEPKRRRPTLLDEQE
ncbi:MAG: hypothetical protein ACODAQ_04235 [Phycisphaeraceae bacterium]